MRCNCLSGVRVLFNLVSLIASTVAPTFAYSQALTLVQSGTRYAGTITSGFNGDFGAATTVSLNTPSYIVFDSQGNQYISSTLTMQPAATVHQTRTSPVRSTELFPAAQASFLAIATPSIRTR